MKQEVVEYAIVFMGSTLLVVVLTPLARALAHRLGMVDHPGTESYKWHHHPTAYLGGLPIMVAVGAIAVASRPASKLLAVLAGALVCGLAGAWDDWKPTGVMPKLIPPMAGAVGLWIVGVRAGFTGIEAVDFVITVLWIVGVTQSLNVIDNMNGVATGVAGLAATAFFVVSATHGQTHVALLAVAIAGACLGFLPFNYRNATVFLGDAGTLSLGFLIGALALAIDVPGTAAPTRLVGLGLIVGVPLFNTALVVAARVRSGRRVTVGGTDGTAHRLVALGMSRSQAAVVFWVVGAMLGAAGIVVLQLGVLAAALAAVVATAAGLVAMWVLSRVDLQVHAVDPSRATLRR